MIPKMLKMSKAPALVWKKNKKTKQNKQKTATGSAFPIAKQFNYECGKHTAVYICRLVGATTILEAEMKQ